jgi:hypothetical protein
MTGDCVIDSPSVRPICADHMTLPTFGPAGAEDVSLVAGGPLLPPSHLALAATSYEQIKGFHREGLAAGARDNGAPGPRPKCSSGYYGALLRSSTSPAGQSGLTLINRSCDRSQISGVCSWRCSLSVCACADPWP